MAVEEYSQRSNPASCETILKEYELLRAEIGASLANQLQIVSFGAAAIGLVAGAAFAGAADHVRGEALVVFLPLLAYLVLMLWFSEVMRMLRAGGYVLTLEHRLDALDNGDGSLGWEACVWQGRVQHGTRGFRRLLDPDHLRLVSITFLFFTIAGASVALGWVDVGWGERGFAIGAGLVAFFVISMLYALRLDQLHMILKLDPPRLPQISRILRHLR